MSRRASLRSLSSRVPPPSLLPRPGGLSTISEEGGEEKRFPEECRSRIMEVTRRELQCVEENQRAEQEIRRLNYALEEQKMFYERKLSEESLRIARLTEEYESQLSQLQFAVSECADEVTILHKENVRLSSRGSMLDVRKAQEAMQHSRYYRK